MTDSPVRLLDEETLPSLENSPREAIVIDRSFQYTPVKPDSTYTTNLQTTGDWEMFITAS